MRTYADYDALMISNVLTYAEYWPYLTGEFDVPEKVMKAVDREIFSGPYGRWAEALPWTPSTPPLVTARLGNISSIVVRAGHSIDGFRQATGGHWGLPYGSEKSGAEYRIDLEPDEFIDTVEMTMGDKLGSLAFVSNKAKYGPYGSPKGTKTKDKNWKHALLHNATLGLAINQTGGYSLTSIHCTKWTNTLGFTKGCQGVYFGFRPSFFATDDYVPSGYDKNTTSECLFAPLETLDMVEVVTTSNETEEKWI